MAPNDFVVYADAKGQEYTETVTSPIALAIREEELETAGYRVIH